MSNDTYSQHIEKLRKEIIAIINEVIPNTIIPEAVFTRSIIANSLFEVTKVIRELCGEGILELSAHSENAYKLKTGGTIRPPASTPLRTSIVALGVKSKISKTNQVLAYIKDHGPTETPVLSRKFGDSTYSFLQSLRDQNLICLAGTKGNTKIWSLPEDKHKVAKDKPSKTDQILQYIKDNEPVAAMDLANIYGVSTHTFLQNLRRRNLIERVGKDGQRTLWGIVKAEPNEELDTAPEQEIEEESTASQDDVVNHGVPAADGDDFKNALKKRKAALEDKILILNDEMKAVDSRMSEIRRQLESVVVLLDAE